MAFFLYPVHSLPTAPFTSLQPRRCLPASVPLSRAPTTAIESSNRPSIGATQNRVLAFGVDGHIRGILRIFRGFEVQAWKKLCAMPPEEAMEKYIAIINGLYPSWAAGSATLMSPGVHDLRIWSSRIRAVLFPVRSANKISHPSSPMSCFDLPSTKLQ